MKSFNIEIHKLLHIWVILVDPLTVFCTITIKIFFYIEYAENSITTVNAIYIGVVNRTVFISTKMLPAAVTGQVKRKQY
jgi:hypothetical protein